MRPAIGVRRRDAASGRLGGRGGSRWPPRAGHRRALVERQVQVLVYVYYTANQRTLGRLRQMHSRVASPPDLYEGTVLLGARHAHS